MRNGQMVLLDDGMPQTSEPTEDALRPLFFCVGKGNRINNRDNPKAGGVTKRKTETYEMKKNMDEMKEKD